MARLVKFLEGGPHYSPISLLYYDTLIGGTMGAPTATQLTIASDRGGTLVIKGSFTIENGVVTGGTATGFDVYAGSLKAIEAKGFSVAWADFEAAITDAQNNDRDKFEDLFFSGARIKGSDAEDILLASDGAKALGMDGNDNLEAKNGNAILKGGDGNDVLFGNGMSRLFGGEGEDVFVIDWRAVTPDAFKDFDVKEDIVGILNDFIPGVTAGPLADAQFHVGKAAKTESHVVIYDRKSGALHVDEDGSGSGAAVEIARLPSHLKLKADNIVFGDFF